MSAFLVYAFWKLGMKSYKYVGFFKLLKVEKGYVNNMHSPIFSIDSLLGGGVNINKSQKVKIINFWNLS